MGETSKKETLAKASISIRRMGVILWCVAAIVSLVFMNLYYAEHDKTIPQYITITAMTFIAALGGVDVWKQGLLPKEVK